MISDPIHSNSPQNNPWMIAAYRTARAMEIFCVIMLAILLANSIRARINDPNNPVKLENLLVQLSQNPKDENLKKEIRNLDVTIRKNYFRSQFIAKYGLCLLIGALVVYLLCLEYLRSGNKTTPLPNVNIAKEPWLNPALSRRSIYVLGGIMGGVLLSLIVLSRHDVTYAYIHNDLFTVSNTASAPASPPPPMVQQLASAPATVPTAPTAATAPTPSNALANANTAAGTPLLGTAANTASSTPALRPVTPTAITPISPNVQTGVPTPSAAASNDSAASIATAYPSSWSNQWNMFRGPSGTGICTLSDIPLQWDGTQNQNILWKAPIPLPGWSSPIVWKDNIFFTGGDKTQRLVYCYSLSYGSINWQYKVHVKGCNTVPQVGDDTGFAAQTMATDGKRVYAIFPTGELVCLDFTGKPLWLKFLGTPDNEYGMAASLLLCEGKLIVQSDQGSDSTDKKSSIMAFDGKTGKQLWRTPRPVGSSWATPIAIKVNGKTEIITAGNPWVISYDPATGKEIWRCECLGGEVAPSPIFSGPFVVVSNQGANIVAIRPTGKGDITKTGIAWMGMDGLPDIVSPLSDGKRVYLFTTQGQITCYDTMTGKELWTHQMADNIKASPTLVGNSIYLLDTKGVMHILAAGDQFNETGKNPVGERTYSSPAYVDNKIIIRGEKDLFCIGK